MKKKVIKVVVEVTKIERHELQIETEKNTEETFDIYQNITVHGSLENFKQYVSLAGDKVINQQIDCDALEDVTVIDFE